MAAVDAGPEMRSDGRDCVLVVVIPTYRHPVLLSEAVGSVLDQDFALPYAAVICSDGCDLRETDLIASSFALADPRIVYLRKPNGGPGSARNAAIDYALERFPNLTAIFFLDSDNRLTPTALSRGYRALGDFPDAGWIYPHIDAFGIAWHGNYATPYSPLLHIAHENICDTGSFVRREVFEAGVRFDEDARSGFEDWDFWLQCLGKGFVGQHAPYGFDYRQRPESRYREMNRLREQVLERLRQRHWPLTSPGRLVAFEHATNPRYLLTHGNGGHARFTDPAGDWTPIDPQALAADLRGYFVAPESVWAPSFFLFGSVSTIDALRALRIVHNALWLLERAPAEALLAVVTLKPGDGEIRVEAILHSSGRDALARAGLLLCPQPRIAELIRDAEGELARRLADDALPLPVYEIAVSGPLPEEGGARVSARDLMIRSLQAWRRSDLGVETPRRWIWRPQELPARHLYYPILCRYIGAQPFVPRLKGDDIAVGFVIPIASFGGAEKVAYALAAELKRRGGFSTHLFVMSAPRVNLISGYEDAFDTVNFLADAAYPVWGGPARMFGESLFRPGAPEIRAGELAGFLGALDVVINCQSGPFHSALGALRARRIRTVAYVHVTDFTELGRPAGHPFLIAGFEHAYDLVATCSRRLAEELHALGAPAEKIVAVPNAASFAISPGLRARASLARSAPRGRRPFRCLYLGRFDRQKGIERWLTAIQDLIDAGAETEFRLIGAAVTDPGDAPWEALLAQLPVSVEPPLFDTEALVEAYLWADVLVLSSRWEGAPLVIPEAQQLGAIPLCVNVGAIAELIDHEEDGLLVEDGDDPAVAAGLTHAILRLIRDDDLRRRLCAGAIARAGRNSWQENFRELVDWLEGASAG